MHIDQQQQAALKHECKGVFFEHLFQASSAPFLIVKPDSPRFTIVEVNDVYLRATMRTREELIGRGLFQAFTDNLHAPSIAGVNTLRASLDRVLALRRPDIVTSIRYDVSRPDGTFEERWWSLINTAVLGENGEVEAILHNTIDVTDQFRAETGLRQSEERLELALRATDLAVYEWDLVSDYLTANERFREMIGIAPGEQAVGAFMLAHCVHPDDRARIDRDLVRAMDSTSSGQFVFDHRLSRPDPRGEVWVMSHGRVYFHGPDGDRRPARVFGTMQDITERKQKELKLRDAEARQRHLISSWAQAVWETDAAGLVTADSPSWRAYTGQTLEESLGYGWLDAIHPDDRAYAERQWRDAVAVREPVNAEFRLRAPDGGWCWTNVRATPLLDAEHNIEKWVGMNIDIDDRKRAETALRGSEERYRSLFESIDEGFCIIEVLFDENDHPYDYRFCETNPAFQQQTGLVDAVGKTMREFALNLEPHWYESYGRVVKTGESVRFQNESKALNRWFNVFAFKIHDEGGPRVAMLFTDISEQKRLTETLHRSEQLAIETSSKAEAERRQLDAVLQAAPVGIVVSDANGTFLHSNAAHKHLWGEQEPDPESMEQFGEWKGWWADHSEKHGQRLKAQEWTMARLLGGETSPRDIFDIESFDLPPVRRTILVTGAQVKGRHGKVIGAVVAQMDISDRIKAEDALRQTDHQKDEFLAMLAHELRNPLAPISFAASILMTTKVDEVQLKETSQIIARQAQHMTNLVDDLLDVSRVTRGLIQLEKAPTDFLRVVADAVEQINPLILARGHHLTLHVPPDIAMVSGDSKRLVQVVANMLSNAAKYTHEGGTISLKTEVQPDTIVLTIEDNGVGIAPELVEHVFDLFTQAERTSDRSSGGLGLGLALVKSLVDLHGGKVTCTSAGRGKGTRFTVSLPRLIHTDQRIERRRNNRDEIKVGKSLKILIVDDNVDAAETLAVFLKGAGHEVLVEYQSQRGLNRARLESPDVCLLDIGLPEMDGNELAKCLRNQPETNNAILIAVTGYGQEVDRQATRAAGFDHHMVKPVDLARLSAALATTRQVP